MKKEQHGGIFITGPVGVGKTFQAKRILKKAGGHRMYNCTRLILEARNPDLAIELIDEATRPKWILLDDLGAFQNSTASAEIIYVIIEERLSQGKYTIITSNLSIADIAEKLDDRLASRLSMFGIMEMTGDDRRILGTDKLN